MARLSVVVPIYNAENDLQECVTSILGQSIFEIELILVDDGSSDSSLAICDAIALSDTRVKVLRQSHKGPIYARQAGVIASSAQYVTFVDSDDFIAKKSYELALPSMRDSVDVIAFGITRYTNEKNQHIDYLPFSPKRYNRSNIQNDIFPNMIWSDKNTFGIDPSLCTKIIKKELLINAYNMLCEKDFHYGEDVAITYPVIKNAKTLEIIHYSYYYHRHKEAIQEKAYLKDRTFFPKLYKLYNHLIELFGHETIICEQIDKFYIASVNLKRREYGLSDSIRHLFPFDRIDKNENIILYGAGKIGHGFYEQVSQLSYCKIVMWVDKNYQLYEKEGVVSPECILNATFDKVVVAVQSNAIQSEIIRTLTEMDVDSSKIVLMNADLETI